MAGEDFKLPGTSFDEIEKVMEAYSKKSGPASNDEIAQLVGSSAATVSRSNGFLVSVGLLQGGHKKEVTELGRKLGLALHHEQAEDVRKYWNQVVIENEFLSGQVTAIRVQKAVKKDDLPSKILYNSKNKKHKFTETGARSVTELLVRSGTISEDNGTYTVAKGALAPSAEAPLAESAETEVTGHTDAKDESRHDGGRSTGFQLAVNLQIQIHEFDDTSKYDDLFRALRSHLLPNDTA